MSNVIEQPIPTAIAEYSQTSAALADLAQRYRGIAFALDTTAGDKEARAARLELVRLRTSLEAKRKELKAPALERSRLIDTEAKRITDAIVELERPIDEQIKAEEARKEAERQRKLNEDRARIAQLQGRIAQIRRFADRAVGKGAAEVAEKIALVEGLACGEDFQELQEVAVAARSETLDRLRFMLTDAQKREADSEQLALERQRLAAERAELEQAQRKQAEERARLDAEAQRVRAEAVRIVGQTQLWAALGARLKEDGPLEPATEDDTRRIYAAGERRDNEQQSALTEAETRAVEEQIDAARASIAALTEDEVREVGDRLAAARSLIAESMDPASLFMVQQVEADFNAHLADKFEVDFNAPVGSDGDEYCPTCGTLLAKAPAHA